MAKELFEDIAKYLNNPPPEEGGSLFLEKDEVESLILSLAAVRGDEGFTEEEAFKVVKWAESVRIQESMLTLIFQGLAEIDWRNDEPMFRATQKGQDVVEERRNGLN